MSRVKALIILKEKGHIDRAIDAKYIGYHDGDFVFGLRNGTVCSVDTVIEKVRVSDYKRGNNPLLSILTRV